MPKEQTSVEWNREDASFLHARQLADADFIVITAFDFSSLSKIGLEAIIVAGMAFYYDADRPKCLCKAKNPFYVTGDRACETSDILVRDL